MKRFFWFALAVVCSSACASAQTQQVSEAPFLHDELTPFTSKTNYMSLPGYLRYLNYVKSGRWEPVINQYIGSDPFLTDKRTLVTESTVTINLGDLAMDIAELMADSVLAQSVEAYVRPVKYIIIWSVTGPSFFAEGNSGDFMEFRYTYDQPMGALSLDTRGSWGGPWTLNWRKRVTDELLFAKQRKMRDDAKARRKSNALK